MARLTPIDYRMDVLNPMQMAMSGYQAGFGQMQQLDDVRRQREADRMAAEVHDMQMGQLEQAQAQAMAEQQEMAIFIDALNKGGVTGERAIQFSNSFNEKIAGAAQKIVTQEQQDKAAAAMNFAGEIFAASDSPDVLKQLLDEGIEAAFTAGDQEQLDYLQTLRQYENMGTEEGKTALNGQAFLTAGYYASQLGDQGKIYMQGLGKILDQRAEAAKGIETKPLTTEAKLNADLEAGRITPEQHRAAMERLSRPEPGLQVAFGEGGTLQSLSFGSGGQPFTTTPKQPAGKESVPVTMPGTGRILISPGPQQKLATKEFTTLAGFKAKNDIVRDEVRIAKELIEYGAGGPEKAFIRELFPNLTRGTATAALQSRLTAIEANIGFNELSDMRQNSPTGGAVGGLSEKEFKNLSSLLGELDAARPQELAVKLDRIVDYISGMEQRAEAALNANYKDIIQIESEAREVERQIEQATRMRYNPQTGDMEEVQ